MTVGILGFGGSGNGDSDYFEKYVKDLDENAEIFSAIKDSDNSTFLRISSFLDENPGGKINLLGYSWGGGDALELANKLGDNGYALNSLITFDPYKTFGSFYNLKHNNVRFTLNFYQQDKKLGFSEQIHLEVYPYLNR